MKRLICLIRGHAWQPCGYVLSYRPGGRRYIECCERCGAER